ncbi:MAG TPA: DUF2244 domain-containing protein [Gammaproteobacteria bacterium]
MVNIKLDDSGYRGLITLRPDLSLSWQSNVRVFLLIALCSLAIASVFVIQGRWLVLPFSGAEIFLLGASLYVFYRRASRTQLIRLSEHSVVIEQGYHRAEQRVEYPRYWSEFHIESTTAAEVSASSKVAELQGIEPALHSIPRVTISSRQQQTELGAFLGYADKQCLIQALKDITARFAASHQAQENLPQQ